MKHSIRKMIAVLMAIILLAQLPSTVCAATADDQIAGIPADQVVEEDSDNARSSLIFPDQYEGDGGIPLTLKYTLTANGLQTTLLLSRSKTITRGNLPSDATKIYITGLLTHNGFSTGTADVIRTGLCYQDPEDSEYFIPAYYKFVPSGTNFTEILCAVSSLSRYITYFPYIKNMEPDYGTVSGSVGFYYSTY